MANEKRLIDANALKDRAIRVVTVKELGNKNHCYIKAVGTHEIDKAPTVDAVEVVRCKDCIHRHYVDMGEEIGAIGGCRLFATPMMTCNDFCSYGERRTDNG